MALGGANPALFRQHNGERIGRGEIKLTEGLRFLALSKRRPSIVSVGLNHRFQLALDQCLEPRVTAQGLLQPVALFGKLILLAADFHLFEPGEVTQFQIEDGLCLHIGNLEGFHEHGFRLVLLADDANDLIDIEKRNEIALKNMEPALNPFQPMLQATLDRRLSEGQPLLKDGDQRLHRRPAVDTDHVEVHAVGALKISSGKQVAHHPVEINAVGPGHQHQARGMLMVRLVAQI